MYVYGYVAGRLKRLMEMALDPITMIEALRWLLQDLLATGLQTTDTCRLGGSLQAWPQTPLDQAFRALLQNVEDNRLQRPQRVMQAVPAMPSRQHSASKPSLQAGPRGNQTHGHLPLHVRFFPRGRGQTLLLGTVRCARSFSQHCTFAPNLGRRSPCPVGAVPGEPGGVR